MTIPSVTGQSAGASSGTLGASKSLANNFDTFLKLLTAQLQNQDPLSPMDSTQFTSQLVQYASVEQQIKSTQELEKLTSLIEGSATTSALGYLGTEVVASADKVRLGAEGDATFTYGSTDDAKKVEIQISDATGKIVRTIAGEPSPDPQSLTWDGRDADGRRLPAGEYKIAVAITDVAGKTATIPTGIRGRVDGVENGPDGLHLIVGGRALPLAGVSQVHRPVAAPAPAA